MTTVPGTQTQRQMPRNGGGASTGPGYLPIQFINCSLPYRAVEEGSWHRVNGSVDMTLTASPANGPEGSFTMVPYGKYARALLLFLCTEAKRSKSKHIVLANSYRGFMRQLGITWNRGSAREAIRQLQALMATTITVTDSRRDEDGQLVVEDLGFRLSFRSKLVFSAADNGDLAEGAESWVELSDEFYSSVLQQFTIPINYKAWAYLAETSKSPLVLDVYCWLSSRLFGMRGKSLIRWDQLHEQFGSQGPLKVFKQRFRSALEAVKEVYPEANVVEDMGITRVKGFKGIILQESPNAMETSWPEH